jgi:hypothetical protein
MWEREIKVNGGWGKCDMSDILEELCKCHNLPLPSTTIKKGKIILAK